RVLLCMNDDFDLWLEDELGTQLSSAAGPASTPEPRSRSVPRRSPSWTKLSIGSGLPLALSAKAVAAFAAAALATGGAAALVVSQHSGGPGNSQQTLAGSSSSSSSASSG